MCKFNPKNKGKRIDKCMVKIVKLINEATKYRTLACCCGHHYYPMSIVVTRGYGSPIEYFSGVIIPRKKRFYFRDKRGVYYIPEVVKGGKHG